MVKKSIKTIPSFCWTGGWNKIHICNESVIFMSGLLSMFDFIQTDIAYSVSTEFTHLSNAVAFDYHLIEWELMHMHLLSPKCFKNSKRIIPISSQLK